MGGGGAAADGVATGAAVCANAKAEKSERAKSERSDMAKTTFRVEMLLEAVTNSCFNATPIFCGVWCSDWEGRSKNRADGGDVGMVQQVGCAQVHGHRSLLGGLPAQFEGAA